MSSSAGTYACFTGPCSRTTRQSRPFSKEIGFDEWNRRLDGGEDWAASVVAQADRFPHHATLIEAFGSRWHETVPGAIPGSVAVLEDLAAEGVALYAITNFALPRWEESLVRFPFLATHFRDVVVSGAEGVTKPDPRIYELCLSRNCLQARSCVFIDDSPANVAGAAAVGLDTIRFTTPLALRQALRRRGLLTGEARRADGGR